MSFLKMILSCHLSQRELLMRILIVYDNTLMEINILSFVQKKIYKINFKLLIYR